MMTSQRACVGESRVRNKLSNGPLRVQNKGRTGDDCALVFLV